MPAGQEQLESTDKASASSVIHAKQAASGKAAGPQPVARTANVFTAQRESGGAAGFARRVGSMQHSVGNARVGRMFGEGGQRKSEPAATTEKVHRKCACGGDAGVAGTCSECKVNRQVEPEFTNSPQTAAPGIADVSQSETPADAEEETRAAGASTGTTKIQRFGLGDVLEFVIGAGGSPAAAAGMIVMRRRVTGLRGRIERIRSEASRSGGIHFTDAQWAVLTTSIRIVESSLPIAAPAFRLATAALFRFGRGIYRVESVIAIPLIIAALLEAMALLLILLLGFLLLLMLLPIIERIVDAIEEAVRRSGQCDAQLVLCLENPWQPDWNRDDYGPRKDCGACYRECKHAGGAWPYYKCPA